ncbi:hypothetical protein MUP77_23815 [Candidatus Bathyarchaeota archaeon]|nr:hypothetical protein [Candidatus Bathyarchaeota archaeon]
MVKAEHYKKKLERDNVNRLLSYMKGKGSVSFTEGKTFLNVSSVTMASYLRQLLEDKQIEHYYEIQEGQKRRKEKYRIKKDSFEKVNSQVGRHEAIRFIEGISNPVYSFRKEGSRAIASFSSVSATMNRKEWEKVNQFIINRFPLRRIPKLKTDQKIAVVIMVEGEGVRP